jgi:hypothetical protein
MKYFTIKLKRGTIKNFEFLPSGQLEAPSVEAETHMRHVLEMSAPTVAE